MSLLLRNLGIALVVVLVLVPWLIGLAHMLGTLPPWYYRGNEWRR